MPAFDQYNDMRFSSALNNTNITGNGDTNGVIIDTSGFEALTFVIQSHTITDGSYAVKIQCGDNASLTDASDVTSEFLLGSAPSFSNTEDNVVKKVGTVSGKRYFRIVITASGVTTGGNFSAIASLGKPKSAPVS